jgi:hypothetical protein
VSATASERASVRGLTARANAPLAGARAAWTITAAIAIAYLLIEPASSDLAAAGYRGELFSTEGLTLWDNAWYGGHHLLAYSLLAPALSAALGAQLLAALSMTIAAALFAALLDGHFSRAATTVACVWFAFGAGVNLLANRVPFDLGIALGLGALLAVRRVPTGRARAALALALAALTALASPVAGAFLALLVLAWAIGSAPRRRIALALAAAALLPIALLEAAFPEGGTQPFVGSAFYPALAGVLIIGALIPARERALRAGTWLYAAVLIAAFLIPSAVGGNADRLGALVAGPLAACVLAGVLRQQEHGARLRRTALVVLAPFLAYWQVNAAVADFAAGIDDPAEHASYYAPLERELSTLGVGLDGRPARLEVVATRNHAEARFLAAHVLIARGWERQLDRDRNALFYDSSALTPARYRNWLARTAVSFVALPDAELDYSARTEAALVRERPAAAGLREIWRSRHWRLFAVLHPTPLAQPPASLQRVTHDSLQLLAPRPGTYLLRVRFTPYWELARGHGCVAEAPGGYTYARVPAAGRLLIIIGFDPARVVDHGPRCR